VNHLRRIDLVVVDDRSNIREGMKALLEQVDQVNIVDEAENGKEAVRIITKRRYDLVLMDLIMPVMGGVDATKAIIRKYPDQKILAFTMHSDDELIGAMIEAGAIGYLSKADEWEDTVKTILQVALGDE